MKTPTDHSAAERIEAEAAAWIARRDAGLNAVEAARFAAWSVDPAHARVFARHEAAWRRFDAPRETGVDRNLINALHTRARKRRRRSVVLASAGAAAVLAFGWILRGPVRPDTPAVASVRIVESALRTLPDGSRVEFAPGAVWQLAFTAGERRIELQRGEAHFEVAKDPARPFVVATGTVEVRAIGTAFNVRLAPAAVEVLVTEGRVAVAAPDAPGEGTTAPLLLVAGQGVSVTSDAAAPAVVVVVAAFDAAAIAERLAWRAARLEFSSTPLREAVVLFNRYNRGQLAVADAETGALEVSGYFRADNAATFVRLIESGAGVRSERRGDTTVLHRAR